MNDPIENFNLVEGVNLDDSTFEPSEILAAQAVVRQYIADRYSDLDLSELSSLNDLVVRPSAQIFLVVNQLIKKFAETNTLKDVSTPGNTLSDSIVDAILSNFSVSRRSGASATGKIRIVVRGSSSSLSIPKTTVFTTVDGLSFSPTQDFLALESRGTGSDLQLTKSSDGKQVYAIVPVAANGTGTRYNIEQYTAFDVSPAPFDLVSATAFGRFSGGTDKESNESVVNRLIPALSARNLASPFAIEQTLRELFPFIQQISVHGINSPLMTRNSHNIFGIKSGCFCDVYVKTSSTVEETLIHKVAEKITYVPTGLEFLGDYIGKYVVRLDAADTDGYYSVSRVIPPDENFLGTYQILKTVRLVDRAFNGGMLGNKIHGVGDAINSSYIQEYIVFDVSGDTSSLPASIEVFVSVDGIPGIKTIQSYVNNYGTQTALVDTLVRACVPCHITLSEIRVTAKVDVTTQEEIQAAIEGYISSVNPQLDSIRSDGIINSIRDIDGVLAVDTPIRISGSIVCPTESMSTLSVQSESILSIPFKPELGLSKDNVGFFIRKSEIPITLIEV